MTVIIDDYSRAIAGFFFSFESPSALQTALVLRQAIRRKSDVHWIISGIPEILYTDDASDFTSAHLEQVAADIKIRLIFSTLFPAQILINRRMWSNEFARFAPAHSQEFRSEIVSRRSCKCVGIGQSRAH